MSAIFDQNNDWRFAQAKKCDFVEKVKSRIKLLTVIDKKIKSIIMCCIQQRIQQINFKKIIQLAKS